MRFSRLAAIGAATVVTVTLSAAPRPAVGSGQSQAPAAAANPQVEQYKRTSASSVDSMQENIRNGTTRCSVSPNRDSGIRDVELPHSDLKQNGFSVQDGVAGIPTSFMATWGSGKPVIALGSDIDDIPQASQKRGVAWHEPIIEGAPGARRRS